MGLRDWPGRRVAKAWGVWALVLGVVLGAAFGMVLLDALAGPRGNASGWDFAFAIDPPLGTGGLILMALVVLAVSFAPPLLLTLVWLVVRRR